MAKQKHPLFQLEGSAELPGRPGLLGGECRACGHRFFPFAPYGCERCGSTELDQKVLSGRGKVLTFSRVHVHPSGLPEAPFTIVAVMLEDGVFVRGIADEASGDRLSIGAPVVTTIVDAPRPDGTDTDIRFQLAEDDA